MFLTKPCNLQGIRKFILKNNTSHSASLDNEAKRIWEKKNFLNKWKDTGIQISWGLRIMEKCIFTKRFRSVIVHIYAWILHLLSEIQLESGKIYHISSIHKGIPIKRLE